MSIIIYKDGVLAADTGCFRESGLVQEFHKLVKFNIVFTGSMTAMGSRYGMTISLSIGSCGTLPAIASIRSVLKRRLHNAKDWIRRMPGILDWLEHGNPVTTGLSLQLATDLVEDCEIEAPGGEAVIIISVIFTNVASGIVSRSEPRVYTLFGADSGVSYPMLSAIREGMGPQIILGANDASAVAEGYLEGTPDASPIEAIKEVAKHSSSISTRWGIDFLTQESESVEHFL